jgi:hypothetical protein
MLHTGANLDMYIGMDPEDLQCIKDNIDTCCMYVCMYVFVWLRSQQVRACVYVCLFCRA